MRSQTRIPPALFLIFYFDLRQYHRTNNLTQCDYPLKNVFREFWNILCFLFIHIQIRSERDFNI